MQRLITNAIYRFLKQTAMFYKFHGCVDIFAALIALKEASWWILGVSYAFNTREDKKSFKTGKNARVL